MITQKLATPDGGTATTSPAIVAATSRAESSKGVTIAAMLNALDGVWTPHGLVTVMTTNHRERLDEALIRAGRIDVDEEFRGLDADQAQRLAAFVDGDATVDGDEWVGRAPAALIQALRHDRQMV